MREAIVLSGGLGTRLRSIVPDLPKSMASIGGRPFLEILLKNLAKKGFKRVILSLGYLAEKITAHFGSSFAGMELHYVIEEVPLGTGGAIRLAISACSQDHAYVFNGDTFLDLEVDQIDEEWKLKKTPLVIAKFIQDTSRYGQLIADPTTHKLISFSEKGISGKGLINAGCYLLNKTQLDSFKLNNSFSFEKEYLNKPETLNIFDVFVTKGVFIDIGVPEDYLLAQSFLHDFK
jgi:D-glycero-alpha-D-manno-heptose 1-phosphate guanylyltransferase